MTQQNLFESLADQVREKESPSPEHASSKTNKTKQPSALQDNFLEAFDNQSANRAGDFTVPDALKEEDAASTEYDSDMEKKERLKQNKAPSEAALHVQSIMIEYSDDQTSRRRKSAIEHEIFQHFDKMLEGMGKIYGRKFGKDADELYTVGKVGLIRAMENFDHTRDDAAKFAHYATVSARHYIKASVMKMNGLSTQGERHLFHNIAKYQTQVDKLMPDLSVEEREIAIARCLRDAKRKSGKNIGEPIVSSLEHAQQTLENFRAKMKKGHTYSLNETLNGDANNDEIINTIVDENALSGDEHIEIEAEKEIVKQAFNKAMDSLSAKQRAVLSVRMHMRPTQDGGERPQFTHDVIGKQLGISAEAVRQREKLGFKNFATKFQEALTESGAQQLFGNSLTALFGKTVSNDNINLTATVVPTSAVAPKVEATEKPRVIRKEESVKEKDTNDLPTEDMSDCYFAYRKAASPVVVEHKKKRKILRPSAQIYRANEAAMAIAAE